MLCVGDGHPTHEWGRYLRRLTKDRNPTITDLARKAGLSRQTLSEYIRDGAESVTIGIVRAIAEAAGDDFINALLAAGNIPRNPIDDEIGLVLDDPELDDVQKAMIIQELEAEREADQRLLDEMAQRDKSRRLKQMRERIDAARRDA